MEIKGQGTLQPLEVSRKEMTQGQNRLGIGSEEIPQLLSLCFSATAPLRHLPPTKGFAAQGRVAPGARWGPRSSEPPAGLCRKIKSDTVSTVSPYISHEVVGPDAMIFVF